MGFFDFLSAPAQDPTLQDQESYAKKKTPFVPQQPQEEAPKTFDALRQKDESQKMAVQGLENDYSKAWAQALKTIDSIPGGHSLESQGKSFQAFPPNPDTVNRLKTVKNALKKVAEGTSSAPPSAFADDFQALAKDPQLAKYGPALNSVAEMFRRADASQKQAVQSRESYAPAPASPDMILSEKQNLETIVRRQQEARERLAKTGFTNPMRAGLENSIAELEKAKKQAETNLKDFGGDKKAAIVQPGAAKKPTFVEENADENLPPTNPKPIENEFKTLGIPREKLVNDAIEILKAVGIDEGSWDDQVPTQAAIKRLLSVMDKEGTFAQKLSEDIMAEKHRNQAQQPDEFASE